LKTTYQIEHAIVEFIFSFSLGIQMQY